MALSDADTEKWALLASQPLPGDLFLVPNDRPNSNVNHGVVAKIRQRQKRLTYLEVNQVVAAYFGGSTTYEIASQFGLHRHTVSRHLKDRGIQLGRRR
ncbi:hypothetical protein [Acidithrix ferrooxidans]|uniref:Uncharacterized protein n=1 Tax=Acidithrix ferrooxidans TaxID=1280514 RepID=A0A0D8HJP1_9ACTN|nr:hypothetical protein [Acidithrix ferrooxidans]KJF18160.1 hypothetical protein AXFE_09050 [Acidithrix ferrooxidans]